MSKLSLTLVCVVLLLGCKEQPKEKSNILEVSEVQEATLLPTQNTIKVGKGPDALFLTPDKRFLYVANVEDTS